MFNMEIMNDANKLVELGWSIDSINSMLFREGYEAIEKEGVAERIIEDEEAFTLSNGWVVVGLY